jgi:predicted nucleic acid-binding protein
MKFLFVDTAGWMACADAADPKHSGSTSARDKWLELGGHLITTDYVIDETLTLLRFRLGLDAAEEWWHTVAASARLRHERVDAERTERARAIFFRYRDKDFSFTDCTSFAVMRELRLRSALTTDRHFRQAGFELFPR